MKPGLAAGTIEGSRMSRWAYYRKQQMYVPVAEQSTAQHMTYAHGQNPIVDFSVLLAVASTTDLPLYECDRERGLSLKQTALVLCCDNTFSA